MKRLVSFLLAIALPVLGGCDAVGFIAERQAIARAQFEFERAELVSADVPFLAPEAGADMTVVLEVTNPNPLTARLDRLDYELFLEGSRVGTGTMARDFAVAPGATEELSLPVHIPYQGLPEAALKAIQARRADLKVTGTSHLSTPFGALAFPVEVRHATTF